MSWFGETFGDSINSLKGQITKITKEVLADDGDSNSEKNESESGLVKELQALCQSKDLEIASLRDEFNKLHDQYKNQIGFLKNKNMQLNSNPINDKNQDDALNYLHIEINQLKDERNHLNSCLDELQSEHEINLNQVISSRDKYKLELEELTKNYNSVKSKLDEILQNQDNCDALNDLETSVKEKNAVINSLNKKLEDFQLQIEIKDKEKLETELNLKKEIESSRNLKQQLINASNEIEDLKIEKRKIEEKNKNILVEYNSLIEKLEFLKKENTILENQVKELTKSKENFEEEMNIENENKNAKTTNIQVEEFKLKLKNLLVKFDVSIEENVCSCDEFFCLLENKLVSYQELVEEAGKKVKEVTDYFESEIKKLNAEKNILKNEIKDFSVKHLQREMDYEEDMLQNKKKLEEMAIKMKELEIKHKQEDLCQSQTDDVKRLEQEISKLLHLCETKTKELEQLQLSKKNLEQELFNSKSLIENIKEQVIMFDENKKKLEIELSDLKKKELELNNQQLELENVLSVSKSENTALNEKNCKLINEINELQKKLFQSDSNNRTKILEEQLAESLTLKAEVDKACEELKHSKATIMQEFENLKAEIITKDVNLKELLKSNAAFQEEINMLQLQNNEIQNLEKEINKWKNASVDLELQNQDLLTTMETLKSENLKITKDLENLKALEAENLHLKQENANLLKNCNKLNSEIEAKNQSEQFWRSQENDLKLEIQKQSHLLLEEQEEKKELKFRIQQYQEQMKIQILQTQNLNIAKDETHQKCSESDASLESSLTDEGKDNTIGKSDEIKLLKETLEKEQNKYKELLKQFQEISDEKVNAKKEFERLRQHLIEIEDHYTEQAVENNNIIEDLKSKLIEAEEQLKNSSTLYTSTKVRDNQHLEALQNQVRLMKAQRDDLQNKVSSAEDEIQKHKASLISLQIVLEQFQQDKERELKEAALKYEKQLLMTNSQLKDFEAEVETLRLQLSEAKNGLKAASRLGEQLEKKTQQVAELDSNLAQSYKKIEELEQNLNLVNQSNSAKIDKSLIKNLVLGYVLSSQADRKSQVLRIMASVLDLSQQERDKIGVDAPNSSWLSNILHPKGGGSPGNESLSEAFIKFLENESRPQPQFKLLPEQIEANKPRPSSSSPKPLAVFSELMLPTFNSLHENESSVILKNVLKES